MMFEPIWVFLSFLGPLLLISIFFRLIRFIIRSLLNIYQEEEEKSERQAGIADQPRPTRTPSQARQDPGPVYEAKLDEPDFYQSEKYKEYVKDLYEDSGFDYEEPVRKDESIMVYTDIDQMIGLDLKKAVIYKEILDPPKALRRFKLR